MNLCVIGAGYVGLVTGSVFSDLGNDVICVDTDRAKIDMLRSGTMPIFEPGLEELVARNVGERRLSFGANVADAVRQSDVIFICVGTPALESGEPDMSHVEAAAVEIARALDGYKVIVNKSTVPAGTGELVRELITRHRPGAAFDVVSNPEFLREGTAIKDTLEPDRIVIGASSPDAATRITELYAPLGRPVLITDVASAEMIKYASNAFLATKISFINSVAAICEVVGADVTEVARGMGLDHRIGPDFLSAGLGFGGSCFPKDCRALAHTAQSRGYGFHLLESVIRVDAEQPARFLAGVRAALGGSFSGKIIAVLGLAFKPNTDDMRDAKSIDLIADLLDGGAVVRAYDPVAMSRARVIFPNIAYAEGAYEAAQSADALLLVTDWNEFKQLNMGRIREAMATPRLFDGRNIYDPVKMRRLGFDYYGVGRPRPDPASDTSTSVGA